ncbi:MAG: hypothetical protein AB7K09_11190 [Planctomycetota bacterium]
MRRSSFWSVVLCMALAPAMLPTAPAAAQAPDPEPPPGQPPQTQPLDARGLLDAGAAAWEAKDYTGAARYYTRAIAAYTTGFGDDTAAADAQNIILRRAIFWCHAQAGSGSDALMPLIEPFFATALRIGTADAADEIASCNAAVCQVMKALAVAKKGDDAEALYRAWGLAMHRTLKAALADHTAGTRAEALATFVAIVERVSWHTRYDHMEALWILGRTDTGTSEFRAIVAHYEQMGEHEQAVWSAQNAFFEMTRNGTPQSAAWFFAETLAALKSYRAASPQAFALVNVRDYLRRLQADGHGADAVAFIEALIAGATQRDAFASGLDEATFRSWLAPLLSADPKAAGVNAARLAELGKSAGDAWLEAIGLTGSAQAALDQGESATLPAALAVAAAARAGDPLVLGRALLQQARSLSARGEHYPADAAVVNAVEQFAHARSNAGRHAASLIGLANAEAAKDDALITAWKAAAGSVAAGGGRAGESVGEMSPSALLAAVTKEPMEIDLLEIERTGKLLKVTNLLDSTSVKIAIDPLFHVVNVSGVMLQLRDAELAVVEIANRASAPATPGESATMADGKAVFSTPDFDTFVPRVHLADGKRVRVTSGWRLVRQE